MFGLENNNQNIRVFEFTIATGQSASPPQNLRGFTVCAVRMAADADARSVILETSTDGGTTFDGVKVNNGFLVFVGDPAATYHAVDHGLLTALQQTRVSLGGAATSPLTVRLIARPTA